MPQYEVLFVLLTNKKNVSAPQQAVLFASLTFSLSPQPQGAELLVSLTNKKNVSAPQKEVLFASLTNKKNVSAPQQVVLFASLTFFPSPPSLNEQCSLSL